MSKQASIDSNQTVSNPLGLGELRFGGGGRKVESFLMLSEEEYIIDVEISYETDYPQHDLQAFFTLNKHTRLVDYDLSSKSGKDSSEGELVFAPMEGVYATGDQNGSPHLYGDDADSCSR